MWVALLMHYGADLIVRVQGQLPRVVLSVCRAEAVKNGTFFVGVVERRTGGAVSLSPGPDRLATTASPVTQTLSI